ncbi:SRPBCC family protein [Streptomyces sp. V4-01]|uniref:SRPBCC family protein n=1 Tax=Actinacidiphila polyblastidii TaxID=3110430 RepID=A0ABU7PBB5_9ACTN|nr:SRPBCC family protein [Streptomyces sp. V4-01]
MRETRDHHPDIHWPAGFSPADGHSFHRVQAVVHGPPERAFAVLTDVTRWTSWVPECREVSTDAFVETFEAHWAGHPFEVFVGENEPPRRLGWLGIGGGVQLYQAWLLTAVEDGTHIVVENVVRSSTPKTFDALSLAWTRRLDELWPAQLKKLSE